MAALASISLPALAVAAWLAPAVVLGVLLAILVMVDTRRRGDGERTPD